MGAHKVSYERAGALNLKCDVFHGVLVAPLSRGYLWRFVLLGCLFDKVGVRVWVWASFSHVGLIADSISENYFLHFPTFSAAVSDCIR